MVCPALLPPWYRATTSLRSARRSTTFPLPSSPHWAPTTTVAANPAPPGVLTPSGGGVPELPVGALDRELHPIGGAVPVLGDVDLGHPLGLGIIVVVVVAVDHQHHVGVLLDGPGLPEVREQWPLVDAGVRGAVQLGHADDRHGEVAREHLERA